MDSDTLDFSILNHTADLGILVRGSDLKELFRVAALSMLRVMVHAKPAEDTKRVKLSVTGDDLADLMVRWLGEILYLLEGERVLVIRAEIDFISHSQLDATLATVPFDSNRHKIRCEIKAVTYHQIEVIQKSDHWEATIIFDL
jgi:SHS2 domain-containing protein